MPKISFENGELVGNGELVTFVRCLIGILSVPNKNLGEVFLDVMENRN